MPDEGIEHIIKRKLQATNLSQQTREYFVGDAFAVDQHTVTIKDNQVNFGAQLSRPGRFFFGDGSRQRNHRRQVG